jgi:hypothetical protein
MTDAPRPKGKYVYPTWITKLLAGENQCWYSAHYKSANKYEKRPDDPERAEFFRDWTARHDALVRRRATELKLEGWTVKVEDEGSFRVRGKNGTISGKPDIVAMKGDEVLIIDAKAGKPRQSDHWQVLIYMMMLPLDWLKGFGTIRGEVAYRDENVTVNPLLAAEKEKIGAALRLVTGDEAPEATPSKGDCFYCDIQNCTFRYQASEGDANGAF